MRYLIATAFCFLLVSQQVQACRGASVEDTLFFETSPYPQLDADVIAKVSLSDVNAGTATVTVMQVLMTSDARVHQGEKFAMKYKFTSCGPNHKSGAEGTIIAKAVADSKGHLVLYPFVRRFSDGHITLPSVSK